MIAVEGDKPLKHGRFTLIVFGAGHKHQLEQHLREARGFELVDPLAYLEKGS